MSLDLHIHSTFSDGTLRPDQIVKLALKKGLSAISITDHDTTEGVGPALESGSQLGIEVVSGIELSIMHGEQHMHLLGYCFDHNNKALSQTLLEIQNARIVRNMAIIERLQKLGIDVSYEEIERKSKIGQTGRPHIAQVLIEKKIARTMDDAFARFLRKGAVAYVPRKVLDAKDAIASICGAGGLPVLAHPTILDSTLKKIPPILDQLVPLGLGGIEAYYPVHSAKNQKQLCVLAARYGLVVTGGSDYHGDIRPGTTLAGGKNVYVPPEVLSNLKKSLGR
jgi:predicted metal-dependent phosphoesterase TrpH